MSRPAKLTATSYVILGLLCTRSWSAYELAQQMQRGWSDVWPRASRGIYNEPKKLVAHGCATSRTERTGARSRTLYAATDHGRELFRAWLAQPPDPPAFESEALIRVLFADQGSMDDLRRVIASVREHAGARSAALLTQGTDYLRSGGPFPDRVHLLHLVGGFLGEQLGAMLRWADWAEAQVATWEATAPAGEVADPAALGEQVVALFAENLRRLDHDGR